MSQRPHPCFMQWWLNHRHLLEMVTYSLQSKNIPKKQQPQTDSSFGTTTLSWHDRGDIFLFIDIYMNAWIVIICHFIYLNKHLFGCRCLKQCYRFFFLTVSISSSSSFSPPSVSKRDVFRHSIECRSPVFLQRSRPNTHLNVHTELTNSWNTTMCR